MQTGVLLVALVLASAVVPNTVPERPKVEYFQVGGMDCLQPLVRGTDLSLNDYRAAALRWLEAEYAGCRVPYWQTWLDLRPVGGGPVTYATETAMVETSPSSVIRVCFDVNLRKD